jgi:hypothetical protein
MKTQLTRTFGLVAKAVLKGKFISMNVYIKKSREHLMWWLKPVILATQRAEIFCLLYFLIYFISIFIIYLLLSYYCCTGGIFRHLQKFLQ